MLIWTSGGAGSHYNKQEYINITIIKPPSQRFNFQNIKNQNEPFKKPYYVSEIRTFFQDTKFYKRWQFYTYMK